MNSKNRTTLVLKGLDCAGCAAKIEAQVNDISEVESASLNFSVGKIFIVSKDNKHLDSIIDKTKAIINKLEPHVKVLEEKDVTDNDVSDKKELSSIAIGGFIFLLAIVLNLSPWFEFGLFFLAYIIVGGGILLRAGRNILKGQVFDENFLMSIATLGAFAIGEFPEGVAVMIFYKVGELFQNIAVNRSRRSIKSLMDIRPDYANLKIDGNLKVVSPEDVCIGDFILVKAGERVPLDGKVVDGESMVDTTALTGESVPRKINIGDDILSGFINKSGLLTIEVTKGYSESTVSKILDLVENASSKKAPTEQFITKFSRYYTPVVVFSALALAIIPPLFIQDATFSEWIYRALIFLVVSCPCALVVSIPLGFFGGIGAASKNGILIKGGNYLEALNHVDTIVFDKTGTLTKGTFRVTEVFTKGNLSKESLIRYAAYGESFSNHPIAHSILREYGEEINKDIIKDYQEISGHGIIASVDGSNVAIGNSKLMSKENIQSPNVGKAGTIIHVAIDGSYEGYIIISDTLKSDAKETITKLKELGIKKTIMLTGDSKTVANSVATKLGLDEYHAELLPHKKVEILESLELNINNKRKLAFVGDGINDAPVLARADVGIAMGGLGSDAAIEASDIVLMTDEPSKIVTAIKIAKLTRKIVIQNIVFALGIKGFVLLLGALGFATMWAAVFADVGVALIAVLNSMRILRYK